MYDIELTIIKASDLIAVDKGGTSDPYVKLEIHAGGKASKIGKTKVVKKNLNPEWNEIFHAKFEDRTATLSIQLWDDNTFKDVKLGQLECAISELPLSGEQAFFFLQPQGMIFIRAKLVAGDVRDFYWSPDDKIGGPCPEALRIPISKKDLRVTWNSASGMYIFEPANQGGGEKFQLRVFATDLSLLRTVIDELGNSENKLNKYNSHSARENGFELITKVRLHDAFFLASQEPSSKDTSSNLAGRLEENLFGAPEKVKHLFAIDPADADVPSLTAQMIYSSHNLQFHMDHIARTIFLESALPAYRDLIPEQFELPNSVENAKKYFIALPALTTRLEESNTKDGWFGFRTAFDLCKRFDRIFVKFIPGNYDTPQKYFEEEIASTDVKIVSPLDAVGSKATGCEIIGFSHRVAAKARQFIAILPLEESNTSCVVISYESDIGAPLKEHVKKLCSHVAEKEIVYPHALVKDAIIKFGGAFKRSLLEDTSEIKSEFSK